MTCEEFDELVAAFALSALPPEEAESARSHLATCRRHDEALARFNDIVERLSLTTEEREPPPRLRARLLDAFDAETGVRPGGARKAGPVSIRPVPLLRPAVVYAAAAVLFLAILGLLAWNLTLQLGSNERQQTLSVSLSGTGGSGELVYSRENQVGVLKLDLPAPPGGRAYQAWQIGASGPASLGLVSATVPSGFSADLSRATAVAVTQEPAGGSPQPTSDPILLAKLP